MTAASQQGGHHTSSNKLEDQAASAALYVTRDKNSSHASHPLLDEDGKLSSAGAATSLKYARPQDLPSFPSAGLKLSSAGAAASLADSNKKPFEHWKPGEIPAANRAALLAKDYEMDPLWQPELSAAGSKAALLAHKDTHSVDIWKAPETEAGQSAAGKAIKIKPPNAITEREISSVGYNKALLAATGAMSGNRRRAGSEPVKPDDSKGWALKAATTSQRGVPKNSGAFASGDPGFEAARIQNLAKNKVNRQMYGSAPPVALEVEERNRQDTLRASAVAMAQKMYAIQQSHIDEASGLKRSDSHAAANKMHHRSMSDASSTLSDVPVAAHRYENLEEAARKLAQERLAKLHDEHAEYRDYYGQNPSTRSRLSMRSRPGASSGAQADDSDEEQSHRIRSQMSMFQSKLNEVDTKKRQSDRDAVLVAAHKNVEARMAKMDEKVFQDTGKASPHQKEAWEKQARERAQKDSDERMQHMGKVHIGGGKYLDQSEIDAIARARLQPTFDDINEKAEKQRARDEELRLDQEKAKADAAKAKSRDAEAKAEAKATHEREKQQLKARKAEEKRVQKEQTSAEKERARLEREEKRQSKDQKGGQLSTGIGHTGTTGAVTSGVKPAVEAQDMTEGVSVEKSHTTLEGDTIHDLVTKPTNTTQPSGEDTREITSLPVEDTAPPLIEKPADALPSTPDVGEPVTSPTKSDSKVKSWFKTRFRSGSKAQKDLGETQITSDAAHGTTAGTLTEEEKEKPDSMKDVAMAGRTTTNETDDMYGSERPVSPTRESSAIAGDKRRSSISSVSSMSSDRLDRQHMSVESPESESEQRGRRGFKQNLMSESTSQREAETDSGKMLERVSSNTDDEEFEEARDTFEEEKLKPPPTLSSVSGENSMRKAASPHGSGERSKFTENL